MTYPHDFGAPQEDHPEKFGNHYTVGKIRKKGTNHDFIYLTSWQYFSFACFKIEEF